MNAECRSKNAEVRMRSLRQPVFILNPDFCIRLGVS